MQAVLPLVSGYCCIDTAILVLLQSTISYEPVMMRPRINTRSCAADSTDEAGHLEPENQKEESALPAGEEQMIGPVEASPPEPKTEKELALPAEEEEVNKPVKAGQGIEGTDFLRRAF